MWSKTRQILLGKIAPSLRGRVNFISEEYRTNKIKYWSQTPIFRVTVDGKTWFADCKYYCDLMHPRFMQKELPPKHSFKHKHSAWGWIQDFGSTEMAIHEYLNVFSLEKCLDYDRRHKFCNILGILDYRLGKRRLRKILASIDTCPDFLYKWVLLRAEAEGLLNKKGKVS